MQLSYELETHIMYTACILEGSLEVKLPRKVEQGRGTEKRKIRRKKSRREELEERRCRCAKR